MRPNAEPIAALNSGVEKMTDPMQSTDEFSHHQHDFTVTHYREIIQAAKKKYHFAGYAEKDLPEHVVYWRHDCDCSMSRALRLAQIEHDEGVKATYFIHPHSEFYNIFEIEQRNLASEIIKLGHDIGLHFDSHCYKIQNKNDLESAIITEKSWLDSWLNVNIAAFSYHNPDPHILEFKDLEYANLINCYSDRFRNEVDYCSDSNGYWRHKRLYDFVSDNPAKTLQVLTHPEWWQEQEMPPRSRIERCVKGRAENVLGRYDNALRQLGRKNIS